MATKERSEPIFSLAALPSLPETRVRASGAENRNGVGTVPWLSSTLPWGCRCRYGTTASGPLVREKFGTYTRDAYTGLDYADQRWFTSAYGRFNTADPYQASGGPSDPSSWNRYSYVEGDPINGYDPRGLIVIDPGIGYSGTGLGPCDYVDPETADFFSCGPGGPSYYGAYSFAPPGAGGGAGGEGGSTALCPLETIVGGYTTDTGSRNPVRVLFAPDAAAALDGAFARLNEDGITPQINAGFRTLADQTNLPPGSIKPAPPGQSWHEVGEAVDIQLKPGTQIATTIVSVMETAGFTWGGDFAANDYVHFQLPPAVYHSNGTVSSGAPSLLQVQNCEREHP